MTFSHFSVVVFNAVADKCNRAESSELLTAGLKTIDSLREAFSRHSPTCSSSVHLSNQSNSFIGIAFIEHSNLAAVSCHLPAIVWPFHSLFGA
jgi:hypothetical protein